jgi:hypothetical protein
MSLGFILGQYVAGRFHPVVAVSIIAMAALGGYCMGGIMWKHNEEAYLAGRDEEID